MQCSAMQCNTVAPAASHLCGDLLMASKRTMVTLVFHVSRSVGVFTAPLGHLLVLLLFLLPLLPLLHSPQSSGESGRLPPNRNPCLCLVLFYCFFSSPSAACWVTHYQLMSHRAGTESFHHVHLRLRDSSESRLWGILKRQTDQGLICTLNNKTLKVPFYKNISILFCSRL